MRPLVLLAATLLVAAAGCAPRRSAHPRDGAGGRLAGYVTHRQRMALPPEAVVEVVLADLAQPDAAARVVASVRVPTQGRQVPIPFALAYDPAAVDPDGQYVLRATVVVGADVLLRSATPVPVLTAGHPADDVEVVVVPRRPAARARRQSARPAPARLEGTHWRLVELHGKPIADGAAGREPHVVLTAAEGRFGGSGGCNRLAGAYMVAGDGLRLRPVATTSMACPSGMEQERAFVQALAAATTFKIDGNTLALLEGGRVIARFEAR
jgi:putative lipoprotein